MTSQIPGRPIRLEKITKTWGETTALTDIDFVAEAGSFTALLGPSGCGKSTLLRIISGLERTTKGRVYIDESDVTHSAPDKRDLSMVFQSYALFPHLNVAENIVFGLRTRRESRAEIARKLAKTSELLRLDQLLTRKPSELSGGQQQRVALGRAIISERGICLMDEPLSNLDAKLRHHMRVELRALQQSLGFTMVYVTHDQAEAMTMADQIVLLNNGQVEQVGTPRDLYGSPATVFAGQFIGTPPMNIFSPKVLSGMSQQMPRLSTDVALGLRPEDIQLDPSGPITGTLKTIEYFGADALLTCTISGEDIVARVSGHTDLTVGAPISLRFNISNISEFDAATGVRRPTNISSPGGVKSAANSTQQKAI